MKSIFNQWAIVVRPEIWILFVLTGCAAWTGRAPNEGRFEQAAASWTGAPLDEMIAVWGPPRQYLDDSEIEGAGIAIWRSTWSDVYRCNINAWYDPDRIVTRIDVTAYKCDNEFDEHLDMLFRRR